MAHIGWLKLSTVIGWTLVFTVGSSPAASGAATPLAPLAAAAASSDDRENTTPTAWWTYAGQTVADVTNTLTANNARIVDLNIEATGATPRFTVTYVSNTGAYAKSWWWYYGVDEATLNTQLTANNARLTVLKAYDSGGGQIRFAAVMIANTGTDAKAWWWYYNKTTADVTTLLQANTARLVQVNGYVTGGQTRYAVVMISNTGAEARGWWWYVNATPADLTASLSANSARLIDLDYDAATGNYNAIMESCAGGCPLWWWYVGATAQQLLDTSAQDGARVIDANPYPGCGSLCYAYVLVNNSNDITSRVGERLRSGTDGVKGLYLKEVNGPVLANLEDAYRFEPASTIKVVLHLYALHQIQTGAAQLTDLVPHYQPPVGTSCPGNTSMGTESLNTALGEMMRHSDNTRTREISDTFGVNNILSYAQSFGMASTQINHVIGCGGPVPNQTTLDDLARLYENVANGTLLDAPRRSLFFSLMAGKAQYQLEGYDWTHLWDTDIPALVNQEAPAGMSAAQKQAFINHMDLAYKAGSYKICPTGLCTTYVDHISIAGWVQIPACTGPARQYLFGLFITNSTSDTTSSSTFNANKAELLREPIHAGLATWCQKVFLPVALR